MNLPSSLSQHLQEALSSPVRDVNAVGGGCISQAAAVTLEDSSTYFIKWNASAPAGFFAAEATGLRELAKPAVIKVPEVISFSDSPQNDCPAYIVLEYLCPGSHSKGADEELGQKLALLHQRRKPHCGSMPDNFIGKLSQENPAVEVWSDFFFENRLLVQMRLGQERGWVDSQLQNLFSQKEQTIRALLQNEVEEASLLHGDLWSGNVYWSDAGPVLIDPAVYYGSREADIAFTELFARFGSSFYHAYNEALPLCPGYQERKEVLNLYHLMTHSNLFGGSYISSVYQTIKRL